MTLKDILKQSKDVYSLELFGDADIEAIEARLSDKAGKPYVKCLVRGKDVQAKPEEVIRQLWIYRLVDHYNYPLDRITVEYPITFGRDTSKRADIVVFDADRPTVPYQMVEIKEVTAKDGKDQLKSYTHATGAPLAVPRVQRVARARVSLGFSSRHSPVSRSSTSRGWPATILGGDEADRLS